MRRVPDFLMNWRHLEGGGGLRIVTLTFKNFSNVIFLRNLIYKQPLTLKMYVQNSPFSVLQFSIWKIYCTAPLGLTVFSGIRTIYFLISAHCNDMITSLRTQSQSVYTTYRYEDIQMLVFRTQQKQGLSQKFFDGMVQPFRRGPDFLLIHFRFLGGPSFFPYKFQSRKGGSPLLATPLSKRKYFYAKDCKT